MHLIRQRILPPSWSAVAQPTLLLHPTNDYRERSVNKRRCPVTTISQFVQGGITTLADLRSALQTAMQLEFSTIPPYLCAQWSINVDPDGVSDLIQDVVVQEMFHFALAGNMLTA